MRLRPVVWLFLLSVASLFGEDSRIRALQARFIAPCCWSEPVSVHRSPAAEEMRAEIARMVAAGRTDDQIVNHFVTQHGERIMMVPRGQRSFWLTLTPFVGLALAGAWLIRYLMRRRQTEVQPALRMAAAAPVRDEDLEW
jgi:cytochrome c-type biogenesis protein CcmH